MAISKVVYDGNTLIDLTSDSVNASNLSKGTTAHNAAGEQIVGTFEQAQSDWNQNDETAVDYVKNRPFYTKNPVETVFFEESTLTFSEVGNGIYAVEIPPTFLATAGKTYAVYWDSTSYECTCVDIGYPVLGNLSIAFDGSDTGEPFVVLMSNEYIVIYTSDTSASHVVSINEIHQEVVKIDMKYLPFMPKPSGKSYLAFSSQNIFSLRTQRSTKTWDGTLEYFAPDNTWIIWDGTSALSAAINGTEYVLYLRGTGNTVISNGEYFILDGSNISCIGNIETLLDYATVKLGEHPIMANNCYKKMFYGCVGLTQAPELPATTLTESCYSNMFYGCTNLIKAPELPATTLVSSCYNSMFYYCISLTKAPKLLATTLANNCCYNMFYNCTSLVQAPELPATTLADYCYTYMFYNCTSLIQAPELPATTLTAACYADMFHNCTNLVQAPELPATTLAGSCYSDMFYGCVNLTQIPKLPAITLAYQCYNKMFYGCTSLKLSESNTEEYTQEYRIPFSGNGTIEDPGLNHALRDMFTSTGGTFTGEPQVNTTYYLSSDNMIARGTEIATLNGYVKNMIDTSVEIPETLPNPQAITFTGTVTGSYDGSEPLSVNIPTAPTKTSQLTNDSGFLTSHQSLAAYRTAAAQDTIDRGKVDKVDGKGLSTNDYTDAAKAKVDALALVATSGSYNDLTNKPTIPTIPEYVQTEAETVARTVNQHQSSDSIVFPFLSDAHCGYYTDTGNAATTLAGQLLDQIGKRTPYDFIVHGGDFSTGAWNTTKLDSFEHIEDYTELMSEANKGALSLWCAGNHDDAAYQTTAGRVTQTELFGLVGRKNRMSGAVCPNGCNYGYLDLENRKLRVIYLDTDDKRSWGTVLISSSSSVPEYLNAQNVGGAQLQWLANTGLDFTGKSNPAEWNIVVVSHAALSISGTITDAVSGTVYAHNTENAAKIINAYRTGKSGSITHNGVTVNYNFTTVESKATVICAVHGHNHKFSSETLTGGILSIGCPNIMNGRERASDDGNTYTKTAGTANGTSFCILTIDMENHKIYADCVGVGYDREFTYTTEVITYTNQIPISTDASGAVYNGVGYKANTYLSGGNEGTRNGIYATGFIPCKLGDTLYCKNVGMQTGQDSHRLSFYDSSKTHLTTIKTATTAYPGWNYGEDGNISSIGIRTSGNNKNTAFVRFCCGYIGDDSIVTVNEPIGQ